MEEHAGANKEVCWYTMPTSGVRGKTYVRLASQKGGVAAHLAPKGVLPQAAPRERAGRQRRNLK